MRVLTQQPQSKTFVNRTTKIGRDITFLWSGANPGDDSADSLFVGSGVNPQLVTTGTSNRGTTLVTNSTGAIEWRLYDPGTNYSSSSGLLRKNAIWSQGVIFKYRNATQAGTNTTLFNVTNGGSWNHRIFVNATGFVQVRNPSWTAGVFLTSDVALTEGDWVSVVVVWESGNTRFYVNGVLQTQTSNLSIYTAGLGYAFFCPVGIDILTAFTADIGWTGEDVLSWHKNPWQLFRQSILRDRILTAFDFDDINAAAAEPTIPVPKGSTKQPLGKARVNRGNRFGRDTQFLWTASAPLYDATDNYRATDSSDRTLINSANLFGEPPQITPTPEGLQYTSTTTPIGSGTGGAIVFRGNNNSSATGDWRPAPLGTGNGITVVVLGRYISSSASNQRLFGSTNQQNSGSHDTFGIVSGIPRLSYPNSYLRPINFAAPSTVPYTLNQVHLTAYIATPHGQFFYVDGKLAGQVSELHYGGATGPSARLAIVPGGMAPIMIAYINRALTRQEVRQLTANPWQLFKPQPTARKLLSVAADYPIIYTPGSDLRSLQLTTPSKVNIANPITKGILFASSPNHGTTDAVSDNTIWDTGSISTVYGRGGLAWVYGRAQQSTSTNLSKPVSSQYYSLFAVLSLEITKVSQITLGHYYAGPGFGHDFTLRIGISDLGKVYVTNGTTTVVADNATVPVNKVITIAATGETGVGTKIYLNGKLIHTDPFLFNTGSVTYQPRRISYTGGALPAATRPWYTYLTAAWTRPLSETEVKMLSQDPLQLFARPQALNKRLIDAVTFDVPQAITRSSYVQTANMPRKFVPVNMAHPLARGIKFASGPVWGNRDAVDPRIRYNEIPNSREMTRFGEAFLPAKSNYNQSVSDTIVGSSSSHTLMLIGCIEEDQYPASIYLDHLGVDWGDNNSFQFRVDRNGRVKVGILNNSGNPRYLTGNREVFPLRKLGVAISVVEAGVGTTLYINGKVAGFSTFASGMNTSGQPRRIAYGLYSSGNPWDANTYAKQYLACGWHRALSPAEVQQISENPWQIFESKLADPLANKLLSVAADYPLIYTPTTSTRYIPLSTPSLVDRSNPLSRDIAFAATPAHGYTDGANTRIQWTIGDSNTQLRILTGRGGRAWNINRYFEVQSSISNPTNAANWTVFCVVSLETNSHAEIPQGYLLTGPGWGDTSVVRMLSNSTGRVTWGGLISNDPVPLRKLTTIAIVGSPAGTTMYMNGELQASTATAYTTGTMPPRLLTYSGSDGPPSAWRPWLIYMSCGWYRALSDTEIQILSQDPLKLFKRPDTTNHKILAGQYKYVETDANGRWIPYNERPTYINYSDLPRSYIQVNKGHPIAQNMIFCSTPAHGFRDAYETDLIWNNPTNNDATGYNEELFQALVHGSYKKYGKAWHIGNKYSAKSASGSKLTKNYNQITLCAFIYINQDTYPIVSYGDHGAVSTTAIKNLIDGGYNNQFEFGIRADGIPYFGYASAGGFVYPKEGSRTIIPLKQLVAVAVTVTGNIVKFYVDGKFIGQKTGNYGLLVEPNIRIIDNPGVIRHTSLEMYLAAGWNRALTDNQIAEFSQHPGQIFQKPSKFDNRYAEAVAGLLDLSRKFLLFFG